MKKPFFLLLISIAIHNNIFSSQLDSINRNDLLTPFEESDGLKTATYEQAILFYKNLAKSNPEISVKEFGTTDFGLPLHLITFDNSKVFKFDSDDRITVLINNGSHAGESDGIDASMMLIRDIINSEELKQRFNSVNICVIPIYNIGGSLNRNSTIRVNQNGPLSYGYKSNASNHNLNYDFIKTETKNTQTFAEIFHTISPEIFIDTHVSDGPDHQYTITHALTQRNKLGGKLADYLYYKMLPEIEYKLSEKEIYTAPHITLKNELPENGYNQFFDSPRYSTGYSTLFSTLGINTKTHMLKSYEKRVKATYELIMAAITFSAENRATINFLRKNEYKDILQNRNYTVQWELDSLNNTTIDFKGYEGTFVNSKITGKKRLQFNHNKPFTKSTKFFNEYITKQEVIIPNYYVIPKELTEVINLLKLNKIKVHPLNKDVSIEVESYKIKNYTTSGKLIDGHYPHSNTEVSASTILKDFNKGDLLIPTNQFGVRYIIETLEPEATDSFFNWNFFDLILEQKERFLPYVFEDLALEILNNNQQLKSEFERKKSADANFSNDAYAQLDFIYDRSKYADKAYLQYPIYRILD